jgi:replicative DNA helicase
LVSVAEFPIHEDAPAQPDRTPPNDPAAEQSVLGAMLLSKDAIADVVELVRGDDFYRPAHQTIFSTVLDLYGRGEPADAVTVASELTKSGEISRVGGASYLHTLVALVPTAANANYYGRIVREQAILRRLVEAGTRIVSMGYAGTGDVDDAVDRAQAEVYDITERRTSEDYLPLSDIMSDALTEIEAISNRDGEMVGVPTGFADLDSLTNGLHPGQLIMIAARPSIGKSTLGVDFCRAASIKHGLTSAIFSLEMSRNEIVMRLLSAEAQVPLQHMRSGTMSEADWSKLAGKMGVVSEAPLSRLSRMRTWLCSCTAKTFTSASHRVQVKLTSSWPSTATVLRLRSLSPSKVITRVSSIWRSPSCRLRFAWCQSVLLQVVEQDVALTGQATVLGSPQLFMLPFVFLSSRRASIRGAHD